jgi:hypothetical protein
MKFKRKNPVLALVVLLYFCLLPGCSASDGTTSYTLKVLNHTMNSNTFSASSPESSATVTGMAQNTGSSLINIAIITVKFYDKDGNLVDSSSASRHSLTVGETWIFAVQSSGPDAWKITRYEISASAR